MNTPTAGAMRAARALGGGHSAAEIIDEQSGLAECVEALQDALVCLAGERYSGGLIYNAEPYAKQKKAIAKATTP